MAISRTTTAFMLCFIALLIGTCHGGNWKLSWTLCCATPTFTLPTAAPGSTAGFAGEDSSGGNALSEAAGERARDVCFLSLSLSLSLSLCGKQKDIVCFLPGTYKLEETIFVKLPPDSAVTIIPAEAERSVILDGVCDVCDVCVCACACACALSTHSLTHSLTHSHTPNSLSLSLSLALSLSFSSFAMTPLLP